MDVFDTCLNLLFFLNWQISGFAWKIPEKKIEKKFSEIFKRSLTYHLELLILFHNPVFRHDRESSISSAFDPLMSNWQLHLAHSSSTKLKLSTLFLFVVPKKTSQIIKDQNFITYVVIIWNSRESTFFHCQFSLVCNLCRSCDLERKVSWISFTG